MSVRTSAPSRRRRVFVIALFLVAALVTLPTISYARALTAPGSAPLSMRTVDWIRAHHVGLHEP